MNVIDLSMTIRNHWRWKIEHVVQDFKEGNDFRSSAFYMGAHAFTHVDTPLHCKSGEATIEQMAVDSYSGEAAVIDLSYKKPDDPITVEDLQKAEHVRMNEKIILLKTCWDLHFSPDSKEYWIRAPYVTEEAAIWLRDKKPMVVGFDFPQDYPMKLIEGGKFSLKEMPTHIHLLNEGILLVEYLCNMSQITGNRVQFLCLPLKFENSEGAPARAIVIENEEEDMR
ncbi:cyclase family protein [Ammoniphilus resinae]|uniref:Kynurenine formamidase n=1 Tax=Ammoniphilus resinae TaxID=861532 RepID=A0ABS4GSW5_9BACL|nr:cyclase family protein [Ammoniphilus resinae]MBP1933353.1 kynurenine formamidase [Ammoniphilus resinae]